VSEPERHEELRDGGDDADRVHDGVLETVVVQEARVVVEPHPLHLVRVLKRHAVQRHPGGVDEREEPEGDEEEELLLRRIEGLGEEDESAVCATQLVIRAST
jgi:hypothetical protein